MRLSYLFILVSLLISGMFFFDTPISDDVESNISFSPMSNISLDAIPIYKIHNNTALASIAVSGDGSPSFPYILNSSYFSNKYLEIKDTDAFFIMENFYIVPISFENETAIYFDNVKNGVIRNGEVNVASHALTIMNSNNINVTNNRLQGVYIGVEIGASDNLVIDDRRYAIKLTRI